MVTVNHLIFATGTINNRKHIGYLPLGQYQIVCIDNERVFIVNQTGQFWVRKQDIQGV